MSFALDDAPFITTRFLIDRNYLKPGTRRGVITHNRNGQTVGGQNIKCAIDADGRTGGLNLSYTLNGGPLKVYSFDLITKPSNLGRGRVWYIVCPVTNRPCRKLYFAGGRFVSRSAINGAMYQIQMEAKRYREIKQMVRPWPEGKRTMYAGKPIKAYVRHKKRELRADRSLIMLARRMGF